MDVAHHVCKIVWLWCVCVLIATSAHADQRLNINTATAEQMAAALSGIGPVKAQAIVSYRDAQGPFDAVDALVEVKGIGPKTLGRLRPLITVGEEREFLAAAREAQVTAAVRRVVAKARAQPPATRP